MRYILPKFILKALDQEHGTHIDKELVKQWSKWNVKHGYSEPGKKIVTEEWCPGIFIIKNWYFLDYRFLYYKCLGTVVIT